MRDLERILAKYRIKAQVRQHRRIYLVSEGETVKVLKPLAVGAGRACLIGELLSKGDQCPLLPRLVRPETDDYYLFCLGNRYLLTEYLPGREADYNRPGDFGTAICAMRDFHQFARDLISGNPVRWSLLKFDPKAVWKKRLREMEFCREMAVRLKSSWSRQYLRVWGRFAEQAHRVIGELEGLSLGEPDTVCYHDWAFHNVMIDGERGYLFDFDYMLVDQPVHDRANLIGRYLRFHEWSTDSLLKSLWNFDRYYPWRTGELRLLRLYLSFPYDYWMLGRQYFIEKQPWSLKYYQDQWERKIAHQEKRMGALDLIKQLE
jgi:CotS family spore coat protein